MTSETTSPGRKAADLPAAVAGAGAAKDKGRAMRIGIVIPSFDRYADPAIFRRLVEEVETLGFDSAWFGDHIVFPAERPDYIGSSWLDAMACANLGLGMTTRLKFGTDVLVAPYRNPLMLAKMAMTASLLSGGRFMLGLGIGWLEGEFVALGCPPFADRAEVTEDYLRVIRLMFEEQGELSYAGRWIGYDNIVFEPKPAHPLPILVGGNHRNALHRAALLGDGWHPLFLAPSDYARGKAEIMRIRHEAGITRPFTFSMSGSEARILPRKTAPQPFRAAAQGTSYAPAVETDDAGRQRYIGTAEQVRDDCLALADAGVEQLVLRFAVPLDPVVGPDEHVKQLHLFAAEVLPHLA
jgi:alkanesulfonate monooxygenase SsuD/methylene tetrahydromethanopterin reductase-like flavin-dependent oxidoreductase (luciferase family)